MSIKYLLTGSLLFSFFWANAQTFNPDKNGHVSDPKFRQLIKSRGYELVGSFDTLQRDPLIVAAPFQKNGKWGRIDNHGKVIEDAKSMDYDINEGKREIKGDIKGDTAEHFYLNQGPRHPSSFKFRQAAFSKYSSNGKYGTRDTSGKEGIPAIYDYLAFYNDSIVNVRSGRQAGAFTADGKELVPVNYDNIQYSFSREQIFLVQKGKSFGVFNKGKEVIPIQYEKISFDSRYKNLLKITANDQMAPFTIEGKQLTPFAYDRIGDFNASGITVFSTGGVQNTKKGLMDSVGNQILPPTYKEIGGFSKKLYRAVNGKYPYEISGLIDFQGKPVGQQDYNRIEYLNNGVAKVSRGKKMGFIDSVGNEVIKTDYTTLEYFNKSGFAIMSVDYKKGLINRKGETVVQPVYDAFDFNSNKKEYFIELNHKRGVLDVQGKTIVPPTYDKLYAVSKYGYRATLDNKEGLLDDNGKIMVPIKYDMLEPPNQYKTFEHGIVKAVLDGKRCRVDMYGDEYFEKVLVEKATGFTPDKDGYVEGPDFQQFMKQKGFQLVSAFDTLQKKPLILAARVMVDGKWRLIDTKGQYIDSKGQYDNNSVMQRYVPVDVKVTAENRGDVEIGVGVPEMIDHSGRAVFQQVNVNGKYGTLDKEHNQVGLPAIYDHVIFMGEGWVMTMLSGKYGMARDDGKVILTPGYESITPSVNKGKFTFEQFFVRENGKYGLVSSDGSEIIPAKYDQLISCDGTDRSNQLLRFCVNRKWGLITKKGKVLLEPTYDDLNYLCPGLMRSVMGASSPRQYGLVDTTGKVLLAPFYKYLEVDFYKKMIHVGVSTDKGDKQGYLALDGKVLFNPVYDEINDFSNGLARVRLNGKYGLIRENEKFAIEPLYDELYILHKNQLVSVEKNHRKGILDMNGNKVVPIEYDELYPANGNFVFLRNEKWGIMTQKEKILTLLDYESVSPGYNCFVVKLGGKWGLMANDGKLITPIKYDRFLSSSNAMNRGLAEVSLSDHRGTIDHYGNEYFPR